MGKSLQGSSGIGTTWAFSPGETTYASPFMAYNDDGGNGATEDRMESTARTAGVLSGLFARVSANTLTTATTTIRSRLNGGNGAQSVSVVAGASGAFSDTSNTDTIADGDTYNVQITAAAGGAGSLTLRVVSENFDATTNHVCKFGNGQGVTYSTASTTWFESLAGQLIQTTTENNIKNQIDVGGTLRDAQAFVVTNTRSTNSTVRSRVNNANGNLAVSITASTTGLFEDGANSDTISAGDDVNFSFTTGTGAGDTGISNLTMDFENATNAKANVYAALEDSTRAASATDSFYPIVGNTGSDFVTEAFAQIDLNFAATLSKFKIYVRANTCTGTVTGGVRVNSADGNQTVSITTLSTGLFEDTSNTDSVASTDDLCYKLDNGTANTLTFDWFGMLIEDTSAAASAIKTINGLAKASVKTFNGLAIASVKTLNGLA